MRILILLPTYVVTDQQIQRARKSCRLHFGDVANLFFTFRGNGEQFLEESIRIEEYCSFDSIAPQDFDHIVVWRKTRVSAPDWEIPDEWADKAYILEPEARLSRLCMDNDCASLASDNSNSNLFTRKAPQDSRGGFAYFPYGYEYFLPGIGEQDQFGFRLPDDFQTLAKRPESHKLIAVFGGSTTWSIHCFPDESYCSLLEKNLNAYSRDKNLGVTYSVLNFGLPGNVVLNQTINYILHAQSLGPDIVIGHDGVNDFFYGLLSDEILLRDRGITYATNLEQWPDILNNQPQERYKQVEFYDFNLPHLVLKAYVERKRQFINMVKNDNALPIWGLQPIAQSKHALCPEEVEALKTFKEPAYKYLQYLYEQFDATVSLSGIDFINFHKTFNRYGEECRLFTDYCHTTPEGDVVIAEQYFNLIVDKTTNHKSHKRGAA